MNDFVKNFTLMPVKAIRSRNNRGKGASIRTGFKYASCNYILMVNVTINHFTNKTLSYIFIQVDADGATNITYLHQLYLSLTSTQSDFRNDRTKLVSPSVAIGSRCKVINN
jgi:hypothetical protein